MGSSRLRQINLRVSVLQFVLLFSVVLILARLFYLQFFSEQYKIYAENNSLRKVVIYPTRGIIYSKDDIALVENEAIYDVMLIEQEINTKKKIFDTLAFCTLLSIDTSEFNKVFTEAKKNKLVYSSYKPFPIVKSITREQVSSLQEELYKFNGVYIQLRTARKYPINSSSHILGSLGEVNQDIIEKDEYYKLGDFIGVNGLEKYYEEILRGKKGLKIQLVNVLNQVKGSYEDGKNDIIPENGKNLHLSIDLELQQYVEKLLDGKKGSLVAIEPKTGEILAMVSSPSFNPNLLVGSNKGNNYDSLLKDPAKPLYSRATQASYPPGSTLKPFEALVGLKLGIITKDYSYSCSGGYRLSARQRIGCHDFGTFDLHNSLRLSCNSYYCNLFRVIVDHEKDVEKGLTIWSNSLKEFGFGKPLGVDITEDGKGLLPYPEIYDRKPPRGYGKGNWKSSTIISLGIGQAEIGTTCLQLANAVSVIANKGYYIVPHLAKSVSDLDNINKRKPLQFEKINVDTDTSRYNTIIEAMNDVVNRGTATMARVPDISVCGKTGTSQNPHGKDHSLFICFAPKENPQIAIACIIENAGFGGSWAAPLSSLVIEKYLKDTISRPYVESRVLSNSYLMTKIYSTKDSSSTTK